MLGWDRYGFNKKRVQTRYGELVLFHPVGSAGHVMLFGTPGAQNINSLFFMLGWDRYRFHKKCVTIGYDKLVFLYPVGSAGDVVHSCASWAQNIDILFSMLGWDCTDLTKSALRHVTLNLCFCI
jgi:hypothetical protein